MVYIHIMEVIYQFDKGQAFGTPVRQVPSQATKLKAITYPNQIFNISDDLESRRFIGPAVGTITLPEGSYTEAQLVTALAPDVTFDTISHRYTFPSTGLYRLQPGLALILGVEEVFVGPVEADAGSASINLGISRLKLSGDGLSTPVYVPHVGRFDDNLYHELAEKDFVTVKSGASQLAVNYWVPALGKEKQLKFRKNHSINLLFSPLV